MAAMKQRVEAINAEQEEQLANVGEDSQTYLRQLDKAAELMQEFGVNTFGNKKTLGRYIFNKFTALISSTNHQSPHNNLCEAQLFQNQRTRTSR